MSMHMRSRTFQVHVSIFFPPVLGPTDQILESLDRLGADISRALLMPSGSGSKLITSGEPILKRASAA